METTRRSADGWKNSSIDPRNKYELYLEPFRRCIEDGGAEGIMTAYNKINGTIGILNPEVTDILKNSTVSVTLSATAVRWDLS